MLVSVDKYWNLDAQTIQSIYDPKNLQDTLYDIEVSLCSHQGRIFFWTESGEYHSALRVEPFNDGYLLFGLQTRRLSRRRGYGSNLVRTVLAEISKKENKPIYVHVEKRNTASFMLHQMIGFQVIADHGKLIDGTVSRRYYTMLYK